MIQVKNLTFGYKKKPMLFEDLNMTFEYGSIYGLLGKNGAGKTTLLKLLSALRFPQSGSITIDGTGSEGRKPSYLERFFLVPEEFDFPSIKIKSFIDVYSPFYKDFSQEQFEFYMKEFKVPRDEKITNLSLGQKKKFLLSFAMACNTGILFMDEPTNGLDIPSKAIFRKLLVSIIDDKKTVIISTHQIKDIEEIIDHITIIDNGKMRFSAGIDRIMSDLLFTGDADGGCAKKDILYKEETFGGTKFICRNNARQDGPVDLELLFNAVISGMEIKNL